MLPVTAYSLAIIFLLLIGARALLSYEHALALACFYFPVQVAFSFSDTINLQSGFAVIGLLVFGWFIREVLGQRRRIKLDLVAVMLLLLLGLNICAILLRPPSTDDYKDAAYLLSFLALYLSIKSNLRTEYGLARILRYFRYTVCLVLLVGALLFLLQFLIDEASYRALLAHNIVPVLLGSRVATVFDSSWNAELGGVIRGVSTFLAPQDFGYFLGIVISLLWVDLIHRSQSESRILFTACFIELLTTLSRGSWVSASIVLCYLCYRSWGSISPSMKRRIIVLAFSVVLAGAIVSGPIAKRASSIFDLQESSNLHRFATWARAVNTVSSHPWTGTANVAASDEETKIAGEETADVIGKSWSHNTYLDFGQQLGVPGIATSLLLFAALFRMAWHCQSVTTGWSRRLAIGFSGVVLWFGVHNMFDDVFFSPKPAMCFWFFAGVVAALPHLSSTERGGNVAPTLSVNCAPAV